MNTDAALATLRGFSGPDLAPGYDAALDRLEAKVATLRKERDAARKQSREASGMYVQANEQITELLQQESFMERKLVAQREDIERLAERVEAAEARCARLQQALAGLESAVRILDVMLREPAAEGLMSAEDYRSYVQGAWLGVDEAAEKAREVLAGPGSEQSSLTESGSAGLPDTPAGKTPPPRDPGKQGVW